jgi:hypothetical protein
MKLTHLDERIHVLDAETDVWKVVRDIAESGVSNADAFVLIRGKKLVSAANKASLIKPIINNLILYIPSQESEF